MDELEGISADELIRFEPEQFVSRRVEVPEPTRLVDHRDFVLREIDEGLWFRLSRHTRSVCELA
jgi:hypothetical protein